MQRFTKQLLLLLLTLALALALAACGAGETQPDAGPDQTPNATESGETQPDAGPDQTVEPPSVSYEPIQEGETARDFTIQLTDGTDFTLSDHQGQVVLLNFWATWCTYCVMEMPAFDMLREAYGEDLVILAVNCDADATTAQAFLEENQYGFPIALDADQTVSALYPTDGLPYSLVIDQDGQVAHTVLGGGEPEDVFAHYQTLLDPLLTE